MKKIDYYNTILRSKRWEKCYKGYYMITNIEEFFLYVKLMELMNGDSVEELNEEEWELFNKTFRKNGLITWDDDKQKFVCNCEKREWMEYESEEGVK